MSATLKLTNLPRFTASLRAVMAATKKTEAEIVNKALKDVAFRAMQFTTFAEPGKIKADLLRDSIVFKIAARNVARRAGTAKVDRRGNTKLNRRGTAQTHSAATRAAIKKEADRILKRRMSTSRAMRAGWIPAVKQLGGSIRGEKQKPGGSASKGYAKRATISQLAGLIANALVTRSAATGKKTSVENLAQAVAGLNKAIEFVSRDRENYARKKEVEKVLRAHSDR